jgi:putative FmdB family regulatory protein
MIYEYYCTKCSEKWEATNTINNRDEPTEMPCPHCKELGVKRQVSSPALSYQGAHSTLRRAGSEWADVLKGIKKASGKENTIDI